MPVIASRKIAHLTVTATDHGLRITRPDHGWVEIKALLELEQLVRVVNEGLVGVCGAKFSLMNRSRLQSFYPAGLAGAWALKLNDDESASGLETSDAIAIASLADQVAQTIINAGGGPGAWDQARRCRQLASLNGGWEHGEFPRWDRIDHRCALETGDTELSDYWTWVGQIFLPVTGNETPEGPCDASHESQKEE